MKCAWPFELIAALKMVYWFDWRKLMQFWHVSYLFPKLASIQCWDTFVYTGRRNSFDYYLRQKLCRIMHCLISPWNWLRFRINERSFIYSVLSETVTCILAQTVLHIKQFIVCYRPYYDKVSRRWIIMIFWVSKLQELHNLAHTESAFNHLTVSGNGIDETR